MIQHRFYRTDEKVVSDGYGGAAYVDVLTELPAGHFEAQLISSKIAGSDMHAPVLDIDYDAELRPSRTPGHYHLFLDAPMSWRTYKRLLRALRKAGIIEPDYYELCLRRKGSFVRVP